MNDETKKKLQNVMRTVLSILLTAIFLISCIVAAIAICHAAFGCLDDHTCSDSCSCRESGDDSNDNSSKDEEKESSESQSNETNRDDDSNVSSTEPTSEPTQVATPTTVPTSVQPAQPQFVAGIDPGSAVQSCSEFGPGFEGGIPAGYDAPTTVVDYTSGSPVVV